MSELVRRGMAATTDRVPFTPRSRAVRLRVDVSYVPDALEMPDGPSADSDLDRCSEVQWADPIA